MPNAETRLADKPLHPRAYIRLAFKSLPVFAIAVIAMAGTASNSDARYAARHAHAARVLNVADTAHLHYVRESDAFLIDEGSATGELPGTVRVQFKVGVSFDSSFTIYTHNGEIIGRGSGELSEQKHNGGRRDVYASFGGTMTVSRGTGRYAHAHGSGGFYGVIDRETYAVTIQTTGRLSY